MKIIIAIDSLKGSLTSIEAAQAIQTGILNVQKDAEVIIKPLADGGEGTAHALVSGMGGKMHQIAVKGPIGEMVHANYGILQDEKTAIIEMAEASGLPLVPKEKRNPLYTTTYGVGEMIKECILKGCRNFIIGIGGSATNDAGIGMLQALGYRFLDKEGKKVGEGGTALASIESIDDSKAMKELKECTFQIACDVNNPLYGENGAAFIYGPQKGAGKEEVEILDNGLKHFSKIVAAWKKEDLANYPGSGAAGGLGFGFMVFLGGKLESGIQIVLKETKIEEEMKDADLVITGEGRLDNQTAMGKAPIGVAKLAKKYDLPVIGIAGALAKEASKCNEEGIDAYFSIINAAMSLDEAMEKEKAKENMIQTIEQITRLIQVARNK